MRVSRASKVTSAGLDGQSHDEDHPFVRCH
jgi:hypothetical protein